MKQRHGLQWVGWYNGTMTMIGSEVNVTVVFAQSDSMEL